MFLHLCVFVCVQIFWLLLCWFADAYQTPIPTTDQTIVMGGRSITSLVVRSIHHRCCNWCSRTPIFYRRLKHPAVMPLSRLHWQLMQSGFELHLATCRIPGWMMPVLRWQSCSIVASPSTRRTSLSRRSVQLCPVHRLQLRKKLRVA